MVDILKLPIDKKFHRFLMMEKHGFFFPPSRSDDYIIIEIVMFHGRSIETKKKLINSLFKSIQEELGISTQDIEIIIIESPKHNWGIRGLPGDELSLNYKTNI